MCVCDVGTCTVVVFLLMYVFDHMHAPSKFRRALLLHIRARVSEREFALGFAPWNINGGTSAVNLLVHARACNRV
jgi:hypothetical protein